MGCHTWFSVPVVKGKDKIIELAKTNLEQGYMTESNKKMYKYALEHELMDPILNLACSLNNFKIEEENTWVLYLDVEENSIKEYNEKNNTNHRFIYDLPNEDRHLIESYSDEPRISGYPDKIIKSYQEMVDFMKTGFTNEDGVHHEFHYDKNRYEHFMNGIKTFFEKHPDGIISFG